MKFNDMPYTRPDGDALMREMEALTLRLQQAADYPQARAVFMEMEQLSKKFSTMATLAAVRHSIDTRDPFYDGEETFFDGFTPLLQEKQQEWTAAMLNSPFRADFAAQFGDLMFVNAEIALKTFDPAIIPQLQQEAALTTQYQKLIASARIPFEGGEYTIAQLGPFKTDPDDERRLAAWEAEGRWYREQGEELDRIYSELTALRHEMGEKLGYGGYTPLGYYRMGRNCYGREDVERFRAAVQKYLVPVADRICRQQAKRLGKEYPLSFADAALDFRSGNPRPLGSAEDILAQGLKFYEELSPETGEFFRTMLENDLLDVLSKEGKAGGGYCTEIADHAVPFIFANFNGTQGDVEVVTHEAGHAFAYWMNRARVPAEYAWPSMEACEVHSMSMEFLAWPWAEGFFGPDADKFRYSHLAAALTFIPYGTLVDHFQHEVYARPRLTAQQRHDLWRELLGIYMPWMRLDGAIPFYAEGRGWQRQQHIYNSPFYYIDYCLAQTVALQIWALSREDFRAAWDRYMAYTAQGGSRTFVELLQNADLDTPFDENALRMVCQVANRWLDSCDPDSIR